MKSLFIKLSFLLLISSISFVSCVSSPDRYIAKQASKVDRAEFLFKQGVSNYETYLVQKNDLTEIPRVRKFFEHTLSLDPLHPQAQIYITRIDEYTGKQYDRYLDRATVLSKKEKRTSAEDYDMAYALARAGEIKTFDTTLMKLQLSTMDSRRTLTTERLVPLSALETKILAEENPRNLAKLVPQANRLMREIDNVDAGNVSVNKIRKSIGSHIGSLAEKDIADAKAYMEKRKYPEAEGSLIQAQRTVSGFDVPAGEEIQGLKYTNYIRWGNAHFDARRYRAAGDKADLAMAINRTSEAINLKAKSIRAVSAAAARDIDTEIDTIVAEVDAYISSGELVSAWNTCNSYIPQMKKKA
ncbi:MAG TPA: hypothetical protein GXZ47_06935, partial [Treponema sp.]|nr:hypothetical protein [Treponema sp.]